MPVLYVKLRRTGALNSLLVEVHDDFLCISIDFEGLAGHNAGASFRTCPLKRHHCSTSLLERTALCLLRLLTGGTTTLRLARVKGKITEGFEKKITGPR